MKDRRPRDDDAVQVVTTAPESIEDERDDRIRRYLITMGIRTASFVLAVATDGWVRWMFVGLAVFLPYIAVVAANAVRPRALGQMRRPDDPMGPLQLPERPAAAPTVEPQRLGPSA